VRTPFRPPSSRSLARRIYSLFAYHLHARHLVSRTTRVTMFGLSLTVPSTVFHPRLFASSAYLAGYVQGMQLQGMRILDMGCGSGVLSLVAASRGAEVTAVDINPDAVATTAANATRNGLGEKVQTIHSDLFGQLQCPPGPFGLIMCNPPFYEGNPTAPPEFAWKAGTDFAFFRRLAAAVGTFLAPGGRMVLVLSSELDVGAVATIFLENGLRLQRMGERKRPFELLMIYEGRRIASARD
jgi:release factor glutamine methyltransferase